MDYITYKRFKGKSISGEVNIPFGTILQEHEKFLYLKGKPICCVTSENGWEHFRPLTDEGKYRQDMLEKLYRWYMKHGCGEDFVDELWPGQENGYWKNRLRSKHRAIGENLSREIWRDTMYAVKKDGAFAGYADSIVLIRLHSNGCYVPCKEAEAEGFCAKMAVMLTDEDGKEYQALSDAVFRLAGKLLKGTEPEGSYEEMGAALPLTDAETAAKILLGEEK